MTRRDVHVPAIPRKALSVVGVRRAGKTSLLWQCLDDRLRAGRPRESLVLLGLEDDRLVGIDAADLDWVIEEYFRRYPDFRTRGAVTLCLDEIQVVPGWERLVRRLVDTEHIELLVSGSSAKLASREVATSLRGRAMEVLVHPFSFREALRHRGREPAVGWHELDAPARSTLDHGLREYLVTGGFPEAQDASERDRVSLLRAYVDVVVLRDVVERHAVSNPLALRWLQRQLLSTPAGLFSVGKLFGAMKSQGIAVGKDTLHAYLSHLEDAFLVRTVWMHTASERQRMVNPRKVYPVDPGLIGAYERTGRAQVGHALEATVFLELERRGAAAGYVLTEEGWEVDFYAIVPGGPPQLVQVCADLGDPETLDREVRALESAGSVYPEARRQLVTLDASPPHIAMPRGIEWWPASRWLLGEAEDRPMRATR